MVGLGALIFARHPALHSLATISLFGIVAVVLVSYTIQPVLFRMLITSQTEKGGAPYTLGSLVNTAYAFGLFVTGCQLLQALISRSGRCRWHAAANSALCSGRSTT